MHELNVLLTYDKFPLSQALVFCEQILVQRVPHLSTVPKQLCSSAYETKKSGIKKHIH